VREKLNCRLKNRRDFLEKLTEYEITCGQNVSMGIRVGYLQSKASSPSPLNFKTQSAFAIYTLCFLLLYKYNCYILIKVKLVDYLTTSKQLDFIV